MPLELSDKGYLPRKIWAGEFDQATNPDHLTELMSIFVTGRLAVSCLLPFNVKNYLF